MRKKRDREREIKCETCIDPKGKRRTDEVVHVLDQCTRHEKERQDLVRKIGYFTDKPTALLYSRQPDQVKALAVFIESVDTNRRAEESTKLEEKRLKLKENKETEKETNNKNNQKRCTKTRKRQ